MKALFFLLLVVNLVFVLYIQFGSDFNSSTQLSPELQPEKIKLLPTPVPTPTPTPAACLEWENFLGTDLQRAQVAIAKREFESTYSL